MMSPSTRSKKVLDMIRARAVVDVVDSPPAHGHGLGKFIVEVWGDQPHDYVRRYEIAAKTDTIAAQEGLQRFSDEISKLIAE